ncbi:UPF0738 family protein [Niallia nealsonii]|uniref:UPF0738 protein CWS01_01545 n=1 Tax=Niallia nealsonii TaxID=115979 RepID=A0A2N0Z7R4_9BACI|nr:hypothetical protein [Niallia nealsonii]PKG25555.1 hypothetical protein CWS01_01545 [Niallia nealsonii]
MNKKLQIIKAELMEKELILSVDQSIPFDHIKAAGQMLVDSDDISFIYLLETDDQYVYLVIAKEYWSEIKESKELGVPVYISNGSEKIALEQFLEELDYLIQNIEGNGNYGEEMEKAVEAAFIQK